MPTSCSQFLAQRRCWTPLLAGLALAACGSGGADVAPAPAQTAAPPAQTQMQTLSIPAGYKLVWSDEFDRPGLPDPAKWIYDTGMNKQGWHNKELQYYSHARAENSDVQDGKLIITARLEAMDKQADWGGQRYSSARLITAGKADWTYGFFEIRAKLPCGKGSWPAIWMLASQGEWPAGGELDIMEQIGHEPTKVFSTVHTTAGSGAHGKGGETQVADACSAFHNYQMHWTAEGVRFGIDGKPHAVYPNPKTGKAAWPFDAPQFLILNIAIGGDLGGAVDDAALPIRMEVEHVRVYQQAK